jgi:hypothetical protein
MDLPYFAGLCPYDQDRVGAKIGAAGNIPVERDNPARPMTQRVERGQIKRRDLKPPSLAFAQHPPRLDCVLPRSLKRFISGHSVAVLTMHGFSCAALRHRRTMPLVLGSAYNR